MRYALTVDGVPVGHVELAGRPRSVGRLMPLASFESIGLAAAARRFGRVIAGVPLGAGSKSGRGRGLQAVLLKQIRWRSRLGLLDAWGVYVAIGGITVVTFADGAPLVVTALGIQGSPVGAQVPRS